MSDKELREEFIKYFDDIQVTQRRGDGGIDLKCNKKEIEQLNLNTIEYAVQAKCYAINNKVGPRDIRDFRGLRLEEYDHP